MESVSESTTTYIETYTVTAVIISEPPTFLTPITTFIDPTVDDSDTFTTTVIITSDPSITTTPPITFITPFAAIYDSAECSIVPKTVTEIVYDDGSDLYKN